MSWTAPTILIWAVLLSVPAEAKKPKAPDIAATPEAGRVLILVNGLAHAREGTEGMGASEWVAVSYAEKRGVPKRNILVLNIPGAEDPMAWDGWHIGWDAFDSEIRQPLLKKLKDLEKAGTVIQYIVPAWGMPSHLNNVPPAKSGDAGLSVDAQLAALQSGEARPQRNPYQNAGMHFADWKNPAGWRMYLVTRLDGPTPQIAAGLVDRAMRAEKTLALDKGVAYIDARGVACCDAYYTADRSMYRLKDTAQAKGIRVVFDEKQELIQSALDTMWAWGWYGPPTEAYRFLEGAVGAQLTSYTAGNLRAPYQGNWVELWLRAGITATWGATSEPATTGYANGDDLLRAFWSGYNFAESSYLASPALNHMMVFVGDPLYAPRLFGAIERLVFFILCSAALLYVLMGYPVLLALLARWRSRPSIRGELHPTVSILLPVHNGERWIEDKLASILEQRYPPENVQIVVITDGCSDRSAEIAGRFPVELIELAVNGGKAVALNRGMERARGEILFFTDVRQPLEPDALQLLVNRFADPHVGVVTGELIIRDGATQEEANVGLYWKYEKWIRKHLSQVDSVLGATGCIYAMRRSLAGPLPAGTLLDDVHLPMQAFFAGYRVVMEERSRAYDAPTGLEAEFWRKVRTQAGIYQLLGQFPALLWPGTRMWFHFASYKFGRLMLPFLLLGIAVGSWLLASPWREAALAAQVLFYGLAAVNHLIPAGTGIVKKLSAAVSAFVVLVAAALCAAAILVVPAKRLWKTR